MGYEIRILEIAWREGSGEWVEVDRWDENLSGFDLELLTAIRKSSEDADYVLENRGKWYSIENDLASVSAELDHVELRVEWSDDSGERGRVHAYRGVAKSIQPELVYPPVEWP